jgi:hypothetical protein
MRVQSILTLVQCVAMCASFTCRELAALCDEKQMEWMCHDGLPRYDFTQSLCL